MKPEYAKIIALFSLFVLTFIASMIPLKLIRAQRRSYGDSRRRHKKIISLLSCFGGGVFFATCILDLLPEVKDKFEQVVQIEKINIDFPIAEFTLSVGFFLVLIFEQIALAVKESHESDEGASLIVNINDEAGHSGYRAIGDAQHNDPIEQSTQIEHSMHQDKSSHSKLRSALLVGALAIHSIFEGLAIGLQSDADDVISIFAAVLIHKTILAFSLGLNLAQSAFTLTSVIKSNFTFAITSPIGIAIGIVVTEMTQGSAPIIASGILQGIACGTFLFVTFFEVLPHEFNHSADRILKLLFVILGFACISVVIFFHPSVPNPI